MMGLERTLSSTGKFLGHQKAIHPRLKRRSFLAFSVKIKDSGLYTLLKRSLMNPIFHHGVQPLFTQKGMHAFQVGCQLIFQKGRHPPTCCQQIPAHTGGY